MVDLKTTLNMISSYIVKRISALLTKRTKKPSKVIYRFIIASEFKRFNLICIAYSIAFTQNSGNLYVEK